MYSETLSHSIDKCGTTNDCFSRHFYAFLLPTSEETTMESASDVNYDSYGSLATQPLHCWWYICPCSVFSSSEKIKNQSWGLFNSLMVKVHRFSYLSQPAFTWYDFRLLNSDITAKFEVFIINLTLFFSCFGNHASSHLCLFSKFSWGYPTVLA